MTEPAELPPIAETSGRRLPLETKLQELFAAIAIGLQTTGDTFGATVVNRRAPELARAWAKLARENPAVKRVLESLLVGTAWGEVAMVTLGTVIPILWHRGLVPDDLGVTFAAGVVPESPEVQAAAARMSGQSPPPPPEPEPEPGESEPEQPTEEASADDQRPAPGPTPSGGRVPGRPS